MQRFSLVRHGVAFPNFTDMCIDDDTEDSDEVRPNGILFLDPRTGDVGTKRYNAMTKRKHLCLEIDGFALSYSLCCFASAN